MNFAPQKGFTLIEVLVALLVIAIAYTGVATAISGFADQRLLLVERHSSHRIAWNRLMEQYRVSRQIAAREDLGETRGSARYRGDRWRWQISEDKAAGRGLIRYRVDVYGPGAQGDEPPSGTLSAFFTRPSGGSGP